MDLMVFVFVVGISNSIQGMVISTEIASPYNCQKNQYHLKAVTSDVNGRKCWDTISIWICSGFCYSYEKPHWNFPYREFGHKVCIHDGREQKMTSLRNCEEDVIPGTERYFYHEPSECKCSICSSSDTSCEVMLKRGQSKVSGRKLNPVLPPSTVVKNEMYSPEVLPIPEDAEESTDRKFVVME